MGSILQNVEQSIITVPIDDLFPSPRKGRRSIRLDCSDSGVTRRTNAATAKFHVKRNSIAPWSRERQYLLTTRSHIPF